jgi:hypothetical protein
LQYCRNKAVSVQDATASDGDEAYLAAAFVQQLITQMRAQDMNGTWRSSTTPLPWP